ncbi:hypothetical protein CIG75_15185 [Tumebacillus algifaecis]|uniref:GP-PDE domain-containing protein n=1 Tax=Tumebacillus algifaecis TaxID=1214604 RepID=A0A223D3G1_9BACL|nr:glycerophosphodiester phosphodiesterase [Tumebacillus algifaecis]ASS76152.1 hypothetical protein CIG75_15185 [Tumebacillus algifaecis]
MRKRKHKVLNLAHRGASGYAPENTMAAFRIAKEIGADGFEFDVQLSKDGVPVIIHDEALVRTTGAKGYVIEHTSDELARLDAGVWYGQDFQGQRIPTLEQVLQTYGDLYLNVELKNSYHEMPGLEEKVIELIRNYGVEQNVLISSFHHKSMQTLHRLAPDLKTGLLYDCVLVDAVTYAKRLGASALHPFYGTVKADLLREAKAAGVQVNVWTVNDEEQMRLCAEAGVDAIITNDPQLLYEVLNSVLD